MASGYRYDDARPAGGSYSSSRSVDPDATTLRRSRLPEANDYRDSGSRPRSESGGISGTRRGPESRYPDSRSDDRYRDEDEYRATPGRQDRSERPYRGNGPTEDFEYRDGNRYSSSDYRDTGDHRDAGHRDAGHRSTADHRDSEHQADYYSDASYRTDSRHPDAHYEDARYEDARYPEDRYGDAQHYDDRRDRDDRAPQDRGPRDRNPQDREARRNDDYRGQSAARDDDRGYSEYEERDPGYRRGTNDRNTPDSYRTTDDYAERGTGQETRRVKPEELGLPALSRRSSSGGSRPRPPADDLTPRLDGPNPRLDGPASRLDGPAQRRPMPAESDTESTVLLPKAVDLSDETTTKFVPRATAGAAALGATRVAGGRPDDASTQIIRRPEDLPRINLPGATDDQATQMFQRPDDMGRPVFVDSSGKRGKYLKIAVRVFGVLCLLFLAGIVLSLTAGPQAMKAVIGDAKTASPTPAASHSAKPSATNTSGAAAPVVPSRSAGQPTKASPTPTKKAPTKSPSPSDDGDNNGGIPTTIPTGIPTTGAADPTTGAADPSDTATGRNRNN